MNGQESDIILKLNGIVDRLLSGRRKFNLDTVDVDGIEDIEDEDLKSLAGKIIQLGEQYRDCYDFIMDLSCGKLHTKISHTNTFASPFKQLHSELRHLTWQIQEIAGGDYDQRVSFSGDFSDAFNKMILALRERQSLSALNKENANLFSSIFSTSPDGIVLCDLNHRIINASNAACLMLQIAGEVNGEMDFSSLIHREDSENYKKFLEGLLNGHHTTVFAELRVVSGNGESFWSELNASILYDSNSNPKGYIIIFRDISERKFAEAKLMQYTEKLDESNRTKDKLFSIIAHDLKSPFNSLLGFSDILTQEANRENVNIEKIRRFSKIMHESAAQSFNLLVNLLEWAQSQSNRIVINPQRLNLSDIISDNVNMSLAMAAGKNIDLKYTTQGNYPLVSDKAMINTLLRNLIGNAIKYTPQGGNINISLVKDGGMYLVSVHNSGLGIPPEVLENLFRVDAIQSTPGTANEKGTGLGLILCKDFVNKIGGDIWAESQYGQGATFTFSLTDLPLRDRWTGEQVDR